jgi:hypothetical protein
MIIELDVLLHNIGKGKGDVGLSKTIVIFYFVVISSTCTSLIFDSQY